MEGSNWKEKERRGGIRREGMYTCICKNVSEKTGSFLFFYFLFFIFFITCCAQT
jgi:hypothetical protein